METLLNAIQGEVVFLTTITQFSGICFDIKRIKRGDLFISYDNHNFELAIQRGAYGILTSNLPFSYHHDHETAIILSTVLEKDIQAICTLFLLEDHRSCYTLSPTACEYIHMLLPYRLYFLLTSYEQVPSFLESSRSCAITPLSLGTPPSLISLPLIPLTLFESKTSYASNISLPECFYDDLLLALGVCHELGYEPDLLSLTYPHTFFPQFIDNFFTPLPFGGSEKALIFSQTHDPILHQLLYDYIRSKASWSKILFLSSHNVNHFKQYHSYDELTSLLSKERYNFALICDTSLDKNQLLKDLKEHNGPKRPLLFTL